MGVQENVITKPSESCSNTECNLTVALYFDFGQNNDNDFQRPKTQTYFSSVYYVNNTPTPFSRNFLVYWS